MKHKLVIIALFSVALLATGTAGVVWLQADETAQVETPLTETCSSCDARHQRLQHNGETTE